MPRKRPRPRVAAGVVRRADRGDLYLRFRAVVYEHQVLGLTRPARPVIAGTRDVYRRATNPSDWLAAVAEARELRESIEAELLIELRRERRVRVTLADVVEHYETDAARRGIQLDVKRYLHGVILRGLGRDTVAEDLSSSVVLAWLERLRSERQERGKKGGRKLGAGGLRGYVVALHAALNLAARHGLIRVNPVAGLAVRGSEERRPEVLSIEEMERLVAAIPAWESSTRSSVPLRGIVLVGYYTMGRIGRVLELEWSSIDLSSKLLTYPRTKNRIVVTVPLYGPLLAWLTAAHAAREETDDPSPWVFPDGDGRPYRDVRKAWRGLLRTAGLPEGFRLYNLRHTGATHLAATGAVSAIELAQLLGDPRVSTVERRYFGSVTDRHRVSLRKAARHRSMVRLSHSLSQKRPTSADSDGSGAVAADPETTESTS